MFFVLSKVGWALVAPSNFIALALLVGLLAMFFGRRRMATAAIGLAGMLYFAGGVGPLGILLLQPLEDRFPRPPADLPAPDGIIVLGGGLDEEMLLERKALVLTEGGSRMTDAVILARRYPSARIIFTGGSANVLTAAPLTEADAAREFFLAMGIEPARMTFENRSRNTDENARFTRDVVAPKPGQRWLLVTSAFHQPRAVGLFRKAGFDVTAWPSDYLTLGTAGELTRPSSYGSQGLSRLDEGVREWLGLIAYRLDGKIDDLLPQP